MVFWNNAELSCAPYPVSSSGNISQNFTATSRPGCGHWYGTRCRTVLSPPQFLLLTFDLSQPHLLLLSLHTVSMAVTNSFSISEFCHFENVIEKELYHMWSLEIGFFAHSAEFSWHSSKLFPVSIVLFYCWLVVCDMGVPLFNHSPVEGHLGGFSLGLLWIKLLCTFMHRFLCGHGFHFFGINAQECNSGSYDTCMFNFLDYYRLS